MTVVLLSIFLRLKVTWTVSNFSWTVATSLTALWIGMFGRSISVAYVSVCVVGHIIGTLQPQLYSRHVTRHVKVPPQVIYTESIKNATLFYIKKCNLESLNFQEIYVTCALIPWKQILQIWCENYHPA